MQAPRLVRGAGLACECQKGGAGDVPQSLMGNLLRKRANSPKGYEVSGGSDDPRIFESLKQSPYKAAMQHAAQPSGQRARLGIAVGQGDGCCPNARQVLYSANLPEVSPESALVTGRPAPVKRCGSCHILWVAPVWWITPSVRPAGGNPGWALRLCRPGE